MNNQYDRRSVQRNEISVSERLDVGLILDSGMEKTEDFIKEAENFASDPKITTNQLRDLYDLVIILRDIPADSAKRQIAKILIKLEYAYRRQSIKSQEFYNKFKHLLETLLKSSDDKKKVRNFIDFMEAVVAYSKDKNR